MNELKKAVVGDQVMSYFDPRKKTEIIVDASPFGLSGLLVQEGIVLGYASRALTDIESRHTQTERDACCSMGSRTFVCLWCPVFCHH